MFIHWHKDMYSYEKFNVGDKIIIEANAKDEHSFDIVSAKVFRDVKDKADVSYVDSIAIPKRREVWNGETLTLADNTEYVGREEITNLTIIYPDTDFICSFNFTLASEGSITITLPESKYIGSIPSFANGETWELNIKNGVVVGGLVE